MLRPGLHPELKERLRSELLAIDVDPRASPTLAKFGLEHFAPVTYEHYASEKRALRECAGGLGSLPRWPVA